MSVGLPAQWKTRGMMEYGGEQLQKGIRIFSRPPERLYT